MLPGISPPPQRTQQHCVESAKALLPREARQAWATTISGAENVQSKTTTRAVKRNAARGQLGRNGYCYKPQFGIVVIVESERDQERAYARLQRAGFKKLRVVSV